MVPFMWSIGFVPQFLHDKKYSLISIGHDSKPFKALGNRPRRVFFKEPSRSIYLEGWATTIISRRNPGSIGLGAVVIRMIQKETKEIAARMNVD